MTDTEILQKALDQAKAMGYIDKYNHPAKVMMNFNRYYSVIFRHPFARAFWGDGMERCSVSMLLIEKCKDSYHKCYSDAPADWQYHLQQMVLVSDPIRYLEKYLLKEDSKEAQTKEEDL